MSLAKYETAENLGFSLLPVVSLYELLLNLAWGVGFTVKATRTRVADPPPASFWRGFSLPEINQASAKILGIWTLP